MMARLGQNVGIKLLSLVCALALYLYVRKQQAAEEVVQTPLVILNDARTRVVEDPSGRRMISVTLSGPADRLKAVGAQVRASVNLRGQPAGVSRQPVLVEIPEEARRYVDVTWLQRWVQVRLEERIQRQMPVQPVFNVQPPPGLTLTQMAAQPDMVMVGGWETAVRRVKRLQAVANTLDASEESAEVSVTATVRAYDEQGAEVGEEIQLQPPIIKLAARLARATWSKPVFVSPVLSELPAGIRPRRVSVSPRRLTVTGAENAVGPVEYLETEPIPLPAQPGVVDREVRVILPPGVKTVERAWVRVVISLQQGVLQ